jgi:Alpha-amylase/alpha-mannosidase
MFRGRGGIRWGKPWENYPNFGDDFLTVFFRGLAELQNNGTVKIWKPSEFAKECKDEATPLSLKEYKYFNPAVDISLLQLHNGSAHPGCAGQNSGGHVVRRGEPRRVDRRCG